MQNHLSHQEPSPMAKKPPRPPPLSVSLPSYPDLPAHPEAEPEPEPESKRKSYLDESPHSPLQSESSLRSDDPEPPTSCSPATKNVGGAMVAVEKYYSPLTSPLPTTPPDNFPPPPVSHHHVISFNRREEEPPQSGFVYGGGAGNGTLGFVGKKKGMVTMVALVLRALEFVFCLVSFSVMASNKTQGWSGDSFDRYKEYRYCLTVAIMGFVYSGFQAYDLSYHLATGKHVIKHHLRHQFDFISDQVLAYLLISASSAAATRVDDWQANWGKDDFTEKASASVSMAFLAFIAFALSSMISGYNLCTRELS